MPIHLYVAVVDRAPDEANWSILIPDFPEVASAAEREEDIARQAFDALQTAVEARQQDGEALPEPTPLHQVTQDWTTPWQARPILLAASADQPSRPVRVNVSLEEQLLARIDEEAARRGMTRSRFLAEGARALLRGGAA